METTALFSEYLHFHNFNLFGISYGSHFYSLEILMWLIRSKSWSLGILTCLRDICGNTTFWRNHALDCWA